MAFGLTATGFIPKTLATTKQEIEDAFKAAFGQSIDVSAESPFGQLIGILAERDSDLWELGQLLYAASTPDGASSNALDNVCAITGCVREAATESTVILTATGTPATLLSAGRQASVAGVGTKFETLADATILAVSAWINGHGYVLGDRVKNNSRIYQCIIAGTSAGSGGPTGTAADITDNTAHWRYLGEGTGAIDVAAEATVTGPKAGASGTITVIETPVGGWQSVINVLDATLGSDLETDAAFRLRREEELRVSGKAALESIRAALLATVGVISANVFENNTDLTDSDGVPPHSIEALVRGGRDGDQRQALFDTVAAGIRTHGSTSGSVTDSQGISHTIKFSRPTEKNIYAIIDVAADLSTWPSDGATQVKTAIVEYGDAQKTGKDVVASALSAQAMSIVGALDVTSVKIGLAPGPTLSTTLAINLRELAVFDSSRITVNVSGGTP